MEPIFKTPYTLVTKERGIITVRRRSQTLVIIALIEMVIGTLVYLISRLQVFGDGGFEQFCFWAAAIILSLAGLMFIAGLLQGINSKVVFDCNSRKVSKGQKTYDFSQINNFSLEKKPFAEREIFFLTALINDKPVRLVSETSSDTLEEVADFLNKELAGHETFAPIVKEANTSTVSWAGRYFLGVLLIALGLIWSGTGFLFLQSLIFADPRNGHGPLIWPLGIWIAGLGFGELIGIPVGRVLKGNSGRSKFAVIIMILYFGSYLLFCWR